MVLVDNKGFIGFLRGSHLLLPALSTRNFFSFRNVLEDIRTIPSFPLLSLLRFNFSSSPFLEARMTYELSQ